MSVSNRTMSSKGLFPKVAPLVGKKGIHILHAQKKKKKAYKKHGRMVKAQVSQAEGQWLKSTPTPPRLVLPPLFPLFKKIFFLSFFSSIFFFLPLLPSFSFHLSSFPPPPPPPPPPSLLLRKKNQPYQAFFFILPWPPTLTSCCFFLSCLGLLHL